MTTPRVVIAGRRLEDEETIHAAVAVYTPLLGLTDWLLHVKIDYTSEDRASCEADEEYMEAWLTFNPARMHEFGDDIDGTVRHEMLHILVWPITHAAEFNAGEDKAKEELARLAYERSVTWLERMPIWDKMR